MKLKQYRFFVIAALAAMFISTIPFTLVNAEEGMFMMDKLERLPLKQAGLKINPSEIYNANGTGLSVAVPRLSIGCSSEFVSPDGLILTNHHCAFDALVAASTADKNYGDFGYRAGSRAEELPAKGYAIDITLREEDITAKVLNGVDVMNAEAVKKRMDEIEKHEQAKVGADMRVQIQKLNEGMFFYQITYKRIKDIRIVYAPPQSIGFYGGDPDNFEWTRHAGDFSFLRAYVAPDGKSAEYSANNVPFKPKKYLTISADGLKEDDFTMIIGYPGGTTRYRESYSIEYNQNIRLPFTIDVLEKRVEALETISKLDKDKAVELQGDIFNLANVIKAYSGGVLAMRRAGLVKQRQAMEARLMEWINQDAVRKAKYGNALPMLKAAYEKDAKTAQKDLVLSNMLRIPQIQLAVGAISGIPKDLLKAAVPQTAASEPVSNRELLKLLLRKAAELPSDQKIAAIENKFGSSKDAARIQAEEKFADDLFENKTITTAEGLNSLLDMSAEQRKTNPLIMFVSGMQSDIAALQTHQEALSSVLDKYRLPFIEATAELNKSTPYPDASFTQRFTYGKVKGYSPREAIIYTPFTTLDGIFEKDTGRDPFDAPDKLRELWQKKDYGNHAVNGTIPLDFLTTNDIIGGNSGSPVLNGKGEQVGIAFDGNYEGLGNDFFFNPSLGRTIVVDIRYVLFLTDKFADAGWILKEMDIKGGNRKAMTAGM
ncbi:MAG: S46 family peptidase [Acidobacteriota bacterium]|nr:S46 family peptidase [Acidobacteriota bacterium]